MSKESIEKILAAQKIDKERLQLIRNLEKGKIKIDLDKATRTIEDSKKSLLQLESEARNLQDNYQKIAKIVEDTLAQINKTKAEHSESLELCSEYLSKLATLESQLSEIERRIIQKNTVFKNISLDVAKSSAILKNLAQKYDEAKKQEAPKIQSLKKQFDEKVQGVDEKLLTKYRTIRENKGSDTKDIVVPLTLDNRCQGCFMEVPVAMINKIQTDGWTICSECGRIIYQA